MPSALPFRYQARPLTARESARVVWLLLCVKSLRRRLERASRRLDQVGADRSGGRLLHLTRRWLACHAELAAIFGVEEPSAVAEVRAIFRPQGSDQPSLGQRDSNIARKLAA